MRKATIPLLAILLLPTAAAVPTATFTSPHIELQGGELSADLAILRIKIADGAVPPADFHLTTPTLHVELDHTATATGAPTPYYHDPQTTSSTHHNATLTGLVSRAGGALYVLPLQSGGADVTVQEMPCVAIDAPLQARERTEANVRQRAPQEVDTSHALRIQPCQDAVQVTVTGDLWMQFWNWDAHLQSREDTRTIQTGFQSTQGAPVGRAQEAFLRAEGATLSFTLTRDSTWLYAQNATATGVERLHVEEPRGTLTTDEGATALRGQAVEWEGGMTLQLRGTAPGEPFQVQAQGVQPLGAVQPAITSPAGPAASLLLPALAVFLLGAAVVAFVSHERPLRAYERVYGDPAYSTAALHDADRRERRMRGLAVMAHESMRRGHELRAKRVLGHLNRQSKSPLDALLVEGEVCLNLGQYLEARNAFQAALDAAPNRPTQTQARVGLAAVEAAQHRYAQAEDCLASSPDLDPWILSCLLRGNRVFAPIGPELLQEWFGQDPTPDYIQ